MPGEAETKEGSLVLWEWQRDQKPGVSLKSREAERDNGCLDDCPPTPSPPLAGSKASSAPPLNLRMSGRPSEQMNILITQHNLLPLLPEAWTFVFHSFPGHAKAAPVSRSRVCILSKPLLPALPASFCESMTPLPISLTWPLVSRLALGYWTHTVHIPQRHAIGHIGLCGHPGLLYLRFAFHGRSFEMTEFKGQGY